MLHTLYYPKDHKQVHAKMGRNSYRQKSFISRAGKVLLRLQEVKAVDGFFFLPLLLFIKTLTENFSGTPEIRLQCSHNTIKNYGLFVCPFCILQAVAVSALQRPI